MEKHNYHIRINPYAVALVDEGCPQETINALTKMSELVFKKYEDKSSGTSNATSGEDGLVNLSTSPLRLNFMKIEIEQIITDHLYRNLSLGEAVTKILRLFNVSGWVAYDWNKPETRPKKYDKYFVCRKDGKVHWETWNGSGWAYNENVITHWHEIEPPCR